MVATHADSIAATTPSHVVRVVERAHRMDQSRIVPPSRVNINADVMTAACGGLRLGVVVLNELVAGLRVHDTSPDGDPGKLDAVVRTELVAQ